MQFFKLLLLFLSLAYGGDIHQKLIIDGYRDLSEAKAMLMESQLYIMNNKNIKMIVKKEHLKLEIETIGDYSMIVLRPIESKDIKERLMLALGKFSPSRFCIEDEYTDLYAGVESEGSGIAVWDMMRSDLSVIGLEWIVLLLLSIIGLTASIVNRKKLSLLNSMQKDIITNQKKMENEINSLETKG